LAGVITPSPISRPSGGSDDTPISRAIGSPLGDGHFLATADGLQPPTQLVAQLVPEVAEFGRPPPGFAVAMEMVALARSHRRLVKWNAIRREGFSAECSFAGIWPAVDTKR
jgi:hypothetical protein